MEKLLTVAKSADMHHRVWVDNVDQLVAGSLEKFEGCHLMENTIKSWIVIGNPFCDFIWENNELKEKFQSFVSEFVGEERMSTRSQLLCQRKRTHPNDL
jgi:hypothetical protein